MAGPLAHIFCTLALVDAGAIDGKDICSIVRGTSFNDIRYLDVIDRDQTHDKNATWDDVKNAANPFDQGMIIHSLLDIVRERYVLKNKLYEMFPKHEQSFRVLKFYEDNLLFDKTKLPNEILKCFDSIDSHEKKFNIPEDKIVQWHKLMQDYLREKPSSKTISILLDQIISANSNENDSIFRRAWNKLISLGKRAIIMYQLSKIMPSMHESKDLKEKILLFYDHCPEYLIQTQSNAPLAIAKRAN